MSELRRARTGDRSEMRGKLRLFPLTESALVPGTCEPESTKARDEALRLPRVALQTACGPLRAVLSLPPW